MTTLSITKCVTYSPDAVNRALSNTLEPFGGFESFIKKNQTVLIKPNFLMLSHPKEGTITHPALIFLVAKKIKELGANVFIGDSSAFNSALAVANACGLKEKTDKLNIPIVNLNKKIFKKASNNKKYLVDPFSQKADVIINLPKLKAHCQMRYTGAVKNMFGCVPGKFKALRHFQYGKSIDKFADMLIYNYQLVRPTFTIMDAIESMHRHGPTGGDIINTNMLIAGTDSIAIDTLASHLLHLPIEQNPILMAAMRLNEGQTNLKHINVVGKDLSKLSCDSFIWPDKLTPIRFSLPRIAKSLLKNIYLQFKEKF